MSFLSKPTFRSQIFFLLMLKKRINHRKFSKIVFPLLFQKEFKYLTSILRNDCSELFFEVYNIYESIVKLKNCRFYNFLSNFFLPAPCTLGPPEAAISTSLTFSKMDISLKKVSKPYYFFSHFRSI